MRTRMFRKNQSKGHNLETKKEGTIILVNYGVKRVFTDRRTGDQ